LEEGAEFVGNIVDFYARIGLIDVSSTIPDVMKSIGDEIVFVGAPEACVASVRKYLDAGVNHFSFRVSMGNMPPRLVRRTVTLLGQEVIPHFRS
jgi:alkanesulfonate monooxygenase SsuD/methylene tetrahydromethanopterin reductase-like flavin-dependent oxidoreductase (luciferase family)